MHFYDRGHLAEAGVHGRPLWGIHGTADAGAYAIVLNEGYEDDDDQGKTMYDFLLFLSPSIVLTD